MSVPRRTIGSMFPFVGTEAIAAGELTRGALRWNHTAIHPNIYLPNGAHRTVSTYATAAWLWSRRKGVIAGRAAAALYGVPWIEDTAPIELIVKHGRPRPGVVIRTERIAPDEVGTVATLPVTTPARTALDLARRLPRDAAVAHLDALAALTHATPAEVFDLADRYPRTPGIRQARDSISRMDGGARSPRETRLRLLVVDAGMPTPQTDIAVADEHWEGAIAIGWQRWKVCLEILDEPTTNPSHAVQATARYELLQRLGWLCISVAPTLTTSSIIQRVRMALRQRGAI